MCDLCVGGAITKKCSIFNKVTCFTMAAIFKETIKVCRRTFYAKNRGCLMRDDQKNDHRISSEKLVFHFKKSVLLLFSQKEVSARFSKNVLKKLLNL